MRIALAASALALLLSVMAAPASASPYKQANEYFKVRDRAQLVTTFTAEDVQVQPKQFAGRLVELRGMITAVVGSDEHATLLIQGAEGTPAQTVSLPPDKPLSGWKFLDVGIPVRMLCQVVQVAGSASGSLELVIPVKEVEAVSVDQAREAAAREAAIRKAAQERQKKTPRALASRGVGAAAVKTPQTKLSRAEVVSRYAGAVRHFNRRLSPAQARTIAEIIIDYSLRYDLDARLVMAVIACESNFNQYAVSPVGAMGLGQLMPGTAGDLGVSNPFDLRANLEGSTRLLKNHVTNMERGGRPTQEAVKLALACYNAGAGAVKKYRGIPPYRETQNYVKKIVRLYWQMLPEHERADWSPD